MSQVTVSPKFQVVIPKEVRARLSLRAGTKMEVFVFDGRLEMVPVVPIQELRGVLKGTQTDVPREDDRL